MNQYQAQVANYEAVYERSQRLAAMGGEAQQQLYLDRMNYQVAKANLAPRMLVGNFEPGFYIKHFIKDMKIAIDSAQQMGLATPALALAIKLYEQLAAEENSGTQALFKLYSRT